MEAALDMKPGFCGDTNALQGILKRVAGNGSPTSLAKTQGGKFATLGLLYPGMFDDVRAGQGISPQSVEPGLAFFDPDGVLSDVELHAPIPDDHPAADAAFGADAIRVAVADGIPLGMA